MGFTSVDSFTDKFGFSQGGETALYYTIRANLVLLKESDNYKINTRLFCFKSKADYENDKQPLKYTNFVLNPNTQDIQADLIAYCYAQIKTGFVDKTDDL